MNTQTKNILIRTLNQFDTFSDTQKEYWVDKIKEQIEAHERAIKSIGVGFAENQVQSGRIFLRLFKNK